MRTNKISGRNYRRITILAIILVIIFLIPFRSNFVFEQNNECGMSSNSHILQLNVPEIGINNPLNATYTYPMTGFYPASYGFENDADGNDPEEWFDSSGVGSDAQVILGFLGHDKVLRGYDGGGSSWKVENNISALEGTIELWWAVSSTTVNGNHQVNIRDSSNDVLFGVGCGEGQIRVYTLIGWYDIPRLTTSANTWDHLRIDFRSDSGSDYRSLNPNEFRLYYNEIYHGDYSFYKNGDSKIFRLYSGSAPSGHYGYYDAIGYSWKSSYNIGDNLEEGLLISFDSPDNLEWRAYSLDDQPNITILGDCVIPMPNNGIHRLQIYAENSTGYLYSSNIVHFTVAIVEEPFVPDKKNSIYIFMLVVIGLLTSIGLGLVIFQNKLVKKISQKSLERKFPEKEIRIRNLTIQRESWICPNCHSVFARDYNFCRNCGRRLK
ncbi:MAG: hypothetical protein ACFE8N_10635 [Promethearchaeota archaeon]